jgi:hypothetical protein
MAALSQAGQVAMLDVMGELDSEQKTQMLGVIGDLKAEDTEKFVTAMANLSQEGKAAMLDVMGSLHCEQKAQLLNAMSGLRVEEQEKLVAMMGTVGKAGKRAILNVLGDISRESTEVFMKVLDRLGNKSAQSELATLMEGMTAEEKGAFLSKIGNMSADEIKQLMAKMKEQMPARIYTYCTCCNPSLTSPFLLIPVQGRPCAPSHARGRPEAHGCQRCARRIRRIKTADGRLKDHLARRAAVMTRRAIAAANEAANAAANAAIEAAEALDGLLCSRDSPPLHTVDMPRPLPALTAACTPVLAFDTPHVVVETTLPWAASPPPPPPPKQRQGLVSRSKLPSQQVNLSKLVETWLKFPDAVIDPALFPVSPIKSIPAIDASPIKSRPNSAQCCFPTSAQQRSRGRPRPKLPRSNASQRHTRAAARRPPTTLPTISRGKGSDTISPLYDIG